MYFAPACCAWLLIGVSVVEWPDMHATHAWTLVASRPFHFALAALLGFAVNSLTYAVVILASSVTLKVSGPRMLCCGGAVSLGLTMSVLVRWTAQLASTHMACLQVASTIKGAIVVCVGMVFLHEVVTPLQARPQLLCMKGYMLGHCGVLLPCSACRVLGSPYPCLGLAGSIGSKVSK